MAFIYNRRDFLRNSAVWVMAVPALPPPGGGQCPPSGRGRRECATGRTGEILTAGANDLRVSLVNLWPNRLIGDEELPDDREWAPIYRRGQVLGRYPPWLLENKPSPKGRITFATWKHWFKGDPLLESGLPLLRLRGVRRH